VTLEELTESLAGRYRVERELGSGGMATVYLAHDLKHDRQVALKVVKPEIVATVGADRFVSEIRTTAHLRHPHILPLFDSGAVGGAPFYVMPYIEGESLRARLRRDGRLPIADVLVTLRELADALAYAHGQGIVHRDVKPDNVLLSGRHVFLADFGIARALEGAIDANQTMTATAVVVGTPAYISPEQAAGQGQIDHRADIYAFGVLAYELLAGAPPFQGATGASVMAAHLTAAPDPLATRRPDVPPALAAAVMKCLQKSPADRWPSMPDLLAELDRISASPPAGARRRALPAALGLAAACVVAATAVWLWTSSRSRAIPISVGALRHITRDPGLELDPAISPDGRTLAYVAGPPGQRRLYVRQIDGGRAIALTEPGVAVSQRRPDWSPDGTRIVFQAGQQGIGVRPGRRSGAIYLVPSLGGTPTVLVPPSPDGIALTPVWSPNGSEVAYCTEQGIQVIAAAGGSPRRILPSNQGLHSPRWSPDGASLAYVAGGLYFAMGEDQLGNTETSAIHIVDVATGADRVVTDGRWLDVSPVWTPDGRGLLFVSSRNGGRDVYRQFLSRAGMPEGEPARVTSGLNAHSISLSRDGTLLAYSALVFRANVWSLPIPRDGVASAAGATPVTSGSEKTEKLEVSRDGKWLVFDTDRAGNADVWKLRLDGGEPEQVTRDPAPEFANDWSPDGREILFHAIHGATRRDLMTVSADGTTVAVVAAGPGEEQHGSFGPDGNSVVFSGGAASGDLYNLFVVTRARRDAPWGTPRQITTGTGVDGKWSPDGRQIVYTRRGEVRLVSPDGRDDRAIVAGAPGQPLAQYAVWSRDGATIYFKAADAERSASIWSVPPGGGAPRLLVRFDDPSRPSLRREFATDGARFFFTIAQDESDIWVAELRGK
jgi:eukaryotic-like serine/threonine-protein kinase